MTAPSRYFDKKLNCWVTRCPPGEARGARDLENWSTRRNAGMPGVDGPDDWQTTASIAAGLRDERQRMDRRLEKFERRLAKKIAKRLNKDD